MSRPSPQRAPWTDDELDTALGALLTLAEGPARSDGVPVGARMSRRRRFAPALVAAAVAALLTTGVVLAVEHRADQERRVAAGTLVVSGGIADLGGVRFPVPDGWMVTVTQGADVVTACVAAAPTPGGCDGVTLSIAVGGTPLPSSADAAVLGGNCADGGGGYVRRDEGTGAVGGRPALHYWGGSCTDDGPAAHLWLLLDRSLAITTPPGSWAEQGRRIAAGLDLTRWPHPPGEQMIFWSEATSATG